MEYLLVKRVLTTSGLWDDGLYKVSDETVNIPDKLLANAIVESFQAKGIKEKCKIITIGNNSWTVASEKRHQVN